MNRILFGSFDEHTLFYIRIRQMSKYVISSKLPESNWIGQKAPKESQRVQRLKLSGYNKQDEYSSVQW